MFSRTWLGMLLAALSVTTALAQTALPVTESGLRAVLSEYLPQAVPARRKRAVDA